ncbi:thiamine-binding protein [Clostridium sp. LBM24168]
MAAVNVSLQVLPVVEEKNLYEVVDKVIDYIDSCGVKYEVGPMETTMEGELEELLSIVAAAQKICVDNGANRVESIVKIDYRPTGVTIQEKIGKYRE